MVGRKSQGNRINEKLTNATTSYCPYGAVSSLRPALPGLPLRFAQGCPGLFSIRPSGTTGPRSISVRDDGATQLDESELSQDCPIASLRVVLGYFRLVPPGRRGHAVLSHMRRAPGGYRPCCFKTVTTITVSKQIAKVCPKTEFKGLLGFVVSHPFAKNANGWGTERLCRIGSGQIEVLRQVPRAAAKPGRPRTEPLSGLKRVVG